MIFKIHIQLTDVGELRHLDCRRDRPRRTGSRETAEKNSAKPPVRLRA